MAFVLDAMAPGKTAAFTTVQNFVRRAREQGHARFVAAEDGSRVDFWPGLIDCSLDEKQSSIE
jgi:hypothetical protein